MSRIPNTVADPIESGSETFRAGVPVRAVWDERGLGVPAEGAREDARHRGHAVQPLRQGGQGQGCLLPPCQFNV